MASTDPLAICPPGRVMALSSPTLEPRARHLPAPACRDRRELSPVRVLLADGQPARLQALTFLVGLEV